MAAVFQPLIPQNYSSDQAESALRGCQGHTTQPQGQPANYRPPWPPSLSPLKRWGRCGNSAKEPGSQTRKDIDLYIKRSTVSMSELCSLFPSWEQGSGLITPQVEEGAWRPRGPELCQCVWIYISGCHQLYVQGPPVPAAFPSPRFTVIFRLYRDTTVSRAALSACSLCWFPPAWHSGLTTDSARHLHLWKSNYITYNGFGRSKEKQLSVIKCA